MGRESTEKVYVSQRPEKAEECGVGVSGINGDSSKELQNEQGNPRVHWTGCT